MTGVLWLAAGILAEHVAVISIGLHYAHKGTVTVKRPPQPRPRP